MAEKEDGLEKMRAMLTNVSLPTESFEEIARRIKIIESMTR
jgi:hypothetical protein